MKLTKKYKLQKAKDLRDIAVDIKRSFEYNIVIDGELQEAHLKQLYEAETLIKDLRYIINHG